MTKREKRRKARSGIDGGRCVFMDAEGKVTAILVADPDNEDAVITLDADGNKVINSVVATGEHIVGADNGQLAERQPKLDNQT